MAGSLSANQLTSCAAVHTIQTKALIDASAAPSRINSLMAFCPQELMFW